jgi:hypothetical protein
MSNIAGITVHGGTGTSIAGTSATGDSFAFTAQKIGRLQIGETLIELSENDTDDFNLVATNDVRLREMI